VTGSPPPRPGRAGLAAHVRPYGLPAADILAAWHRCTVSGLGDHKQPEPLLDRDAGRWNHDWLLNRNSSGTAPEAASPHATARQRGNQRVSVQCVRAKAAAVCVYGLAPLAGHRGDHPDDAWSRTRGFPACSAHVNCYAQASGERPRISPAPHVQSNGIALRRSPPTRADQHPGARAR
jgi:hypothetical protein